MKYLPFYFVLGVIILCSYYYVYSSGQKYGYKRGVEVTELKLKLVYLRKTNSEIEAYKKNHRNNSQLLDSLKWEIMKQGQEAKSVNRKLVKKFGL